MKSGKTLQRINELSTTKAFTGWKKALEKINGHEKVAFMFKLVLF